MVKYSYEIYHLHFINTDCHEEPYTILTIVTVYLTPILQNSLICIHNIMFQNERKVKETHNSV
jgi:hypothetical protein